MTTQNTKLNVYSFSGNGRQVGAIGSTGFFTRDIIASSEEEARIKLYDYYEHLSRLKVEVKLNCVVKSEVLTSHYIHAIDGHGCIYTDKHKPDSARDCGSNEEEIASLFQELLTAIEKSKKGF